MSRPPKAQEHPLIAGYLDDTLSPQETETLGRWIQESPEHARIFARAALLHDRLANTLRASAESVDMERETISRPAVLRGFFSNLKVRRFATACGIAAVALVMVAVLWKGLGEARVSAAVVEVRRVMEANDQAGDRTYRITVEGAASPPRRDNKERRWLPINLGRPPKPPMDGAILHVREGGQFVLVRQTAEGLPFVTGCNGRTSWAVRPDGPVRVSSDLTRFNHDLPGHENDMPLINLREGLARLLAAYEVQVLPAGGEGDDDQPPQPGEESSQLIVATKRRGHRGPKWVEITYGARSGLIREMRFIEMPYGPEHFTIRMNLVEERPLDANFFNHEFHHAPDRTVETE